MSNFMAATGMSCPENKSAAPFIDHAESADWAVDAVHVMQTAGLMSGRDGERFAPTGTASRAESAVLLQRFIEPLVK